MNNAEANVQALFTLTRTLNDAPEALKRRVRRAVEVVCASSDGRYLEALDVRLSQLEQDLAGMPPVNPAQ